MRCAVHSPPFRTGGRVPGVRMETCTGERPESGGAPPLTGMSVG